MTLSFDLSKPETRPIRVLLYTHAETALWVHKQANRTELGMSLLYPTS